MLVGAAWRAVLGFFSGISSLFSLGEACDKSFSGEIMPRRLLCCQVPRPLRRNHPRPGVQPLEDHRSPGTLRERSWWPGAQDHRLARMGVRECWDLRRGQRRSRPLVSRGPDHAEDSLQAARSCSSPPAYSIQRAVPVRDTPRISGFPSGLPNYWKTNFLQVLSDDAIET